MSSIIRSVQAMDLLARKGPLGVRAVAQQLELPLGSVHRMLLDLAEAGVVDRTPTGEWELSFRLLEITGLQLERIELPRLFRPFAETIAAATGETVNLNALHGFSGVCIDKVRGNEGMQLDWRIGSRGPLLLWRRRQGDARLHGRDRARAGLCRSARSHHPYTITDPQRLRDEIGRIRERGYSIDDQGGRGRRLLRRRSHLDRMGRAAGASALPARRTRRQGRACCRLSPMLQDACRHVSHRLGYLRPLAGRAARPPASGAQAEGNHAWSAPPG